MAKAADVLRQLVADVAALTARVETLEARGGEWDEEIDLDEDPGLQQPTERAVTVSEDGTISIPPPTAKQRLMRKSVLQRLAFENLSPEHGLSKAEADKAYMEGGAAWLYHFDRDYIMSLGPDVRALIVQDLEVGNAPPSYVHEVARDLLKSDDDRKAAQIILDQLQDGYRPAGSMAQD